MERMAHPILVTGATGNVGRAVVRHLLAAGAPVRALVRDPARALHPTEAEIVAGDLNEPATLTAAFAGVDRMFFFTPPAGGAAVVEAARACGVRHVVLLSSAATQKADPRTNPIAARHDAVEKALQNAGLTWTFLRPDSFASNALAWAPGIRAANLVRAAYADSQRNPIHEDDIAAVATVALLESGHENAAYLLTGPASITQAEQARVIGVAIGRDVHFEELTRDEAFAEMTRTTPPAIAERLLDYAAKSVHTPPSVTRVVEEITRRPARTFAQWALDHAEAFR
jgi:uncharacterized protein YbjT (DUF2867 family)